ncbi:hypothetical protein [Flavobacterium sp. AG291]|uniref:hypothetical protein n=1 Tax=Flavobacterium sp. AG291 TaxID=2184000 RepID=UPI000E2BAB32|nr:hypothetical protein [Flavobacterium sp. AG291]RDI10436.1 hypothetical protein DEU42_10795 [Flavobacterium sp. AG291]
MIYNLSIIANMKIKKILFILLGIVTLLLAILIFHIITAKPASYDNPNLQISRIEFESDIDSLQAKQICSDLRTIKGLTSDSIIVKRNVVVYFHNNKVTDSQKVFDELMSRRHYRAKRYILPPGMIAKEVCPVDQSSAGYKLSRKINQFFN